METIPKQDAIEAFLRFTRGYVNKTKQSLCPGLFIHKRYVDLSYLNSDLDDDTLQEELFKLWREYKLGVIVNNYFVYSPANFYNRGTM